MKKDEFYMQKALNLAQMAADINEVPVGCVIVDKNGNILAEEFNKVIHTSDPSAHAEILAIREACKKQKNYRLEDVTLYSSLEPCTMCAGVMLNARIKRMVYAAKEPKTGVVESVCNLFAQPWNKNNIEISSGVLKSKSEKILKEFFLKKR